VLVIALSTVVRLVNNVLSTGTAQIRDDVVMTNNITCVCRNDVIYISINNTHADMSRIDSILHEPSCNPPDIDI
jgi:hypothetical protein